jgi:hypothetical protein
MCTLTRSNFFPLYARLPVTDLICGLDAHAARMTRREGQASSTGYDHVTWSVLCYDKEAEQ